MDVLLHPLTLIVIGVLSVARVARLLTYDDFPPLEWARPKVADRLGQWASLTICPFCLAPYLMAVQIVWFLLLYHHHDALVWFWLLPNAWWAASYLAAIVVAYDQPDD